MSHYQKPPELYDGLRLHQNENTGGCSPRVIEALSRLRPDQIGFYPPYAAATDAVAKYLGVPPDRVTLTNGLDEGIMSLAVAYLRPSAGGPIPEAEDFERRFRHDRLREVPSRKRSCRNRRSKSSASTPRSPAAGSCR